jgi:arylsulfatase A-like enzyme
MPAPNILWIVTTQWRAAACGYAGDPNARTPSLDALAAASVNYAQAVTPHPLGPQARAALLTGRPCPENGVRNYWDPLPIEARTIAHELRARGYTTAFFGKWHLYRRDRSAPFVGETHARIVVPPDHRGGFEWWEGFESGFLLNDPWLHGSRLPEPVRFEGYQSDVVCRRAAEWVGGRKREKGEGRKEKGEGGGCQRSEVRGRRTEGEREAQGAGRREEGADIGYQRTEDRGQKTGNQQSGPIENRELKIENSAAPWFVVVSLEAPHPPYGAPAAGVAPRDPRAIILPPNVPHGGDIERQARTELAGYYAHIEATDHAIGRLVAAADADATRRGRRVPVVVITSVHGDMHGAHGLFRKCWPHEESVRVPLLIRGQKTENRGQQDQRSVSLVDLVGMTLAWAQDENAVAPTTAASDRRYSLISMPAATEIPLQCPHAWHGVRTPTRKLVLDEHGKPWLLFDLEHDPYEQHNLVAEAAWSGELARLRTLITPPGAPGRGDRSQGASVR